MATDDLSFATLDVDDPEQAARTRGYLVPVGTALACTRPAR